MIQDDRPAPRELHVSGRKVFHEDKWRDCILYYLNGIWSGNLDVTWRPRLYFGGITLRLDEEKGEYFAYGRSQLDPRPEFADNEMLTVGSAQLEIQDGLARFVKNDRIKFLDMGMANGGLVRLWKKSWRSRFGISGISIPEYLTA